MKRHFDYGDGDPCSQDPTHGRMFFVGPTRQWCPSARHTGDAVYLRDGVTPATAPRPADDARTSSRARLPIPASLPAAPSS